MAVLFSMYRVLGSTPSTTNTTQQYQRGEYTVTHMRYRHRKLLEMTDAVWGGSSLQSQDLGGRSKRDTVPGQATVRAGLRNNKTEYCMWLNFTSFCCGCGSAHRGTV